MASRLHTPLCDMLGIEYPIVLAGMSQGTDDRDPSSPRLAAAVSEAGGLGVMGCGTRKPEVIDRRIREVRKLSSKPFGVDLLLPAALAETGGAKTQRELWEDAKRLYPEHVAFIEELARQYNLVEEEYSNEPGMTSEELRKEVEVVLDNHVPVFVAGLGEPGFMVASAHAQGMKVAGMAGAVRHAIRQKAVGVDFVGAQGTEAGGHTGNIATFVLVPQIVDAIAPIPVMAAGGIGTGRQLAAALALGAQAVWCGTLFLTAEESEIQDVHQERILRGASEDFTLSKFGTGKQARGLKEDTMKRAWETSGLSPLPMPYQGIVNNRFRRSAEKMGRFDLLGHSSGQVGGMLTKRRPAKEILMDLVSEAEETIERLQHSVR